VDPQRADVQQLAQTHEQSDQHAKHPPHLECLRQ